MSDVICFMEVFFKEMELMLYSRPNQIPTIVARINQREGLGSKGLTIACNNLVRALQKQVLLNKNQTFDQVISTFLLSSVIARSVKTLQQINADNEFMRNINECQRDPPPPPPPEKSHIRVLT